MSEFPLLVLLSLHLQCNFLFERGQECYLERKQLISFKNETYDSLLFLEITLKFCFPKNPSWNWDVHMKIIITCFHWVCVILESRYTLFCSLTNICMVIIISHFSFIHKWPTRTEFILRVLSFFWVWRTWTAGGVNLRLTSILLSICIVVLF